MTEFAIAARRAAGWVEPELTPQGDSAAGGSVAQAGGNGGRNVT